MASKASNGLQTALIIFVVLLVLVSAATYYFYSEWDTAAKKLADADTKLRQATQDQAKVETDMKDLKILLGVGPDESAAQVKETHKKDMEAYGQALLDAQLPPAQFAEGELHYRHWVEYLFGELRNTKSRVDKDAQAEKQLNKKIADDETAHTKEIALSKEENAKTANELKDERDKFNKGRGDFEGLAADLERKLKDRLAESDTVAKTASTEAEQLRDQIKKLVAINDGLRKRLEAGKESSSRPDGEIAWVDQRERLVWLNIGKDDGLLQQTSFRVVASDETNPASAKAKGNIEVIQVGTRQSQARIVDDTNANPILPGDLIFSAAFERGMHERFALVGKIDIDGDGTSDRKRVRELIELNGGTVDGELTDDGRLVGQVTVNTRYLVLGDPPTDESGLKKFTKVIDDVDRYGVQKLNVKEFLERIGYKSGVRAKALAAGAKASDFPAKLESGVQRKSPAPPLNQFKPRTPKNTADDSRAKPIPDSGN